MSATTTIGDSLKRRETAKRLEVKSGPTSNLSFRDLPLNLEQQSNTIPNFNDVDTL